MGDIPVFVLLSSFMVSAGEVFAYDSQTQVRGAIIGEVSAGGAIQVKYF